MASRDIDITREVVEALIRAGAAYGWELGRSGFGSPDPLIEWRDGGPIIVAEMAQLPSDWRMRLMHLIGGR